MAVAFFVFAAGLGCAFAAAFFAGAFVETGAAVISISACWAAFAAFFCLAQRFLAAALIFAFASSDIPRDFGAAAAGAAVIVTVCPVSAVTAHSEMHKN